MRFVWVTHPADSICISHTIEHSDMIVLFTFFSLHLLLLMFIVEQFNRNKKYSINDRNTFFLCCFSVISIDKSDDAAIFVYT